MMRTALIVNPKYEVNVASLSRTLFAFGAPLMPRCGTPIKKGGRKCLPTHLHRRLQDERTYQDSRWETGP